MCSISLTVSPSLTPLAITATSSSTRSSGAASPVGDAVMVMATASRVSATRRRRFVAQIFGPRWWPGVSLDHASSIP